MEKRYTKEDVENAIRKFMEYFEHYDDDYVLCSIEDYFLPKFMEEFDKND